MKDIRAALEKGEVVIGTVCATSSPAAVEIIGYAGFDYVFICTEHFSAGPYGPELEHLIRAAYAADITPFVRVTQNDPSMIRKALNFGAIGIIVPHVRTKEDAERAVAAAKFPPEGNRGGAPIIRAAKYGAIDWATYWRQANRDTLVMPIVEDLASIDNLEEILTVPGIDVVRFGGFDLAMDLGLDGDITQPEVEGLMDRVIEISRRKGIPVNGLAWNAETARKWVEKGCGMLTLSGDIAVMSGAYRQLLQSTRDAVDELRPAPRVRQG